MKPVIPDDVPTIKASYDEDREWVMDPHGFFTIKPFHDEGVIKVRHYDNDAVCQHLIVGETPEEIWHTIIRQKFISRYDHAAYMGSELRKAYLALKFGLWYNQDSPLDVGRKHD